MDREISASYVGPGPFIGAFCDAFNVVDTIDNLVKWDDRQWNLSPGTLVKSMIINILCGRTAFYHYEEFYKDMDTELIFGRGVHAQDFKDDALAEALDRIYDAGCRKVFSQIIMNGLIQEQVDLSIIHGDTTSRIMYGEYKEEGPLIPTYGHSKDYRPDLKQIVYGLLTSKDGIPVDGNPNSGNLDDKTWNNENIKRLLELFTPDTFSKLVYITDSACVNKTFLEKVQEKKLKFISLVPRTFSLRDSLIERAWEQDEWKDIGRLAPNPKSASYKIWETKDTLKGNEYRFVVVYSTHLDKRKLRGLKSRLAKKEEELKKACEKAMKQEFACEADAKTALKAFIKQHKSPFYPIYGAVQKESIRRKRRGRGRPKKGEEHEYQDVYRLQSEVGPLDEEAFEREKSRLSCFVLITNTKRSDFNGQRVLEEYKSQSVIENKFKFIKSPIYTGPLLLKKNKRIESIAYIILLALFIYSNKERRVRQALEDEDEPLILKGKVKTYRPTGNRILELLGNIVVICEHDYANRGQVVRYLDRRHKRIARVLKLAGFDISILKTKSG